MLGLLAKACNRVLYFRDVFKYASSSLGNFHSSVYLSISSCKSVACQNFGGNVLSPRLEGSRRMAWI